MSEEENNKAWIEELEDRVREIAEGKVQPISGENVIRELRKRNKKKAEP
jgi:hypothetical protein